MTFTRLRIRQRRPQAPAPKKRSASECAFFLTELMPRPAAAARCSRDESQTRPGDDDAGQNTGDSVPRTARGGLGNAAKPEMEAHVAGEVEDTDPGNLCDEHWPECNARITARCRPLPSPFQEGISSSHGRGSRHAVTSATGRGVSSQRIAGGNRTEESFEKVGDEYDCANSRYRTGKIASEISIPCLRRSTHGASRDVSRRDRTARYAMITPIIGTSTQTCRFAEHDDAEGVARNPRLPGALCR